MLYCCTRSHTCETPGTGVAVRCWKWGQLQSYCCWRCRLLLATLLYTTAALPWPVAMQMDQKMQQHLKTQEKKASQEFVRKCLLVHHANSLTRNFSGNSTRLLKLSAQKLSTFFEQWELQAGTYPLAVNWFKLSRFCLPCCKDQSYYYLNLSVPFHPSCSHCRKVINFCVGDFKSLMPFCVCRKKSIYSFWSWAYLCFSHFLSL